MISETVTVSLGDRSYDIYFGPDIYPFFQEWICRFYPGGTVFVVTDRTVASIYLDDIERWLSGIPHAILEIPAGEETKGFETVRSIYSFLAGGEAGRDALVVAFGGGVVGDLAGFAAATWLRGIPFIQVPTTLLSQVDSSVGGKTGFNLPEGKNLVGAFHQPRAVFVDHTFLRTLDDRNVLSGLAEIVKCALAGDAEMWERLRHDAPRWKEFGGSDWQWLTRRSIAFKASVVERDETESSLRKVLNLGHTVGHAFEQAAGYGRILHGEAVAMGIAWEAILGRRLGITPPALEETLFTLLLEMGYRLDDPEVPITLLASAAGQDKKRSAFDVDIPFVSEPGQFLLQKVPLSKLRSELPGIRAEIRERLAHREAGGTVEAELVARIGRGESAAVAAELEARIAASPWDLPTLSLLAAAYQADGKLSEALGIIKEVLARNPADIHAQRQAREIEDAIRQTQPVEFASDSASAAVERMLVLEEGAFELRPADLPEPPAMLSEAIPEPPVVEMPVAEPAIPESVPVLAEAEAEVAESEKSIAEPFEPGLPEPQPDAWPAVSDLPPDVWNEGGGAAVEPVQEPVPETVAEAAEPIPEPLVEPVLDAPNLSVQAPSEPDPEAVPPCAEEPPPDAEEASAAPAVRTVTMATLYWQQGDRETALAIVDGILEADPLDERAAEWKARHLAPAVQPIAGEEVALNSFLDRITKEYGHGLSRDH
jgi:3-dehydroquinate synthase